MQINFSSLQNIEYKNSPPKNSLNPCLVKDVVLPEETKEKRNHAWNYYTYIRDNTKINYKDNPEEHEKDIFLGLKIAEINNILEKINEQTETENDEEKKQALSEKREQLLEKKSVYVNELVSRHLVFALKMAHQLRKLPLSYAELVSSANLGLVKAANRFDPYAHDSVHFVSYARHWIKQQMYKDATRNQQIIVPDNVKLNYYKIKKAISEYRKTYGTQITNEELSKITGIKEDVIKDTLRYAAFTTFSLDEPVDTSGDDSRTKYDFIENMEAFYQFEEKMKEEDKSYIRNMIDKVLNEKERFVILNRYKIGEEQLSGDRLRPYEEIASKMGLTTERARQLEQLALKKLKEACKSEIDTKDEKSSANVKSNKIEDNIITESLIYALSKNEKVEIRQKLETKLKSYTFEQFLKILDNVTVPKSKNVIMTQFSRKNSPDGKPISIENVAKKLKITYANVSSSKTEALKDLKRFLLSDGNYSKALLRDYILDYVENENTKNEISERINNTDINMILKIVNNILPEKEALLIKTKFGLDGDSSLGFKVRESKKIEEITSLSINTCHNYVPRALQKLRDYFSTPQKDTTNIAFFAENLTYDIKDEALKNKAIAALKNMDKSSLQKFLKSILTEREYITLNTRFNLEKGDEPKQPVIIYDIISAKFGYKLGTYARGLERTAFVKIQKYFENGCSKNQLEFVNKICSKIKDANLEEMIYKKLTSANQEKIDKILSDALKKQEKDFLVCLYNLNNKYPRKKSDRYDIIRTNYGYSTYGILSNENRILNKLVTHFM